MEETKGKSLFCLGSGNSRHCMNGEYEERRGCIRERLDGVIKTVTYMPLETSRFERSRRGMMWPDDGNG